MLSAVAFTHRFLWGKKYRATFHRAHEVGIDPSFLDGEMTHEEAMKLCLKYLVRAELRDDAGFRMIDVSHDGAHRRYLTTLTLQQCLERREELLKFKPQLDDLMGQIAAAELAAKAAIVAQLSVNSTTIDSSELERIYQEKWAPKLNVQRARLQETTEFFQRNLREYDEALTRGACRLCQAMLVEGETDHLCATCIEHTYLEEDEDEILELCGGDLEEAKRLILLAGEDLDAMIDERRKRGMTLQAVKADIDAQLMRNLQ